MSTTPGHAPRSRWEIAGLVAFGAMAVGIALRLALAPDLARQNVWLKVFAPASEGFLAGADLYAPDSGFRYPPLAAALMAPFTWLPQLASSIAWRWALLFVLALGIRACLRANFPFAMTSRERGVFLLLSTAAVVGSANIGQPNTLILGGMLAASTAAMRRRSAVAAVAVAANTALKVYPLAHGLVLGVLRPRLLAWIAIGTALVAGLPFVLQKSDYVLAQYRALIEMLGAEDRTNDPARAYRDLRSLCASLGWSMSHPTFLALQASTGAAIAAACWWLQRRRFTDAHVFEFALATTSCWCLLLGPATERVTYCLLGPSIAWQAIRAWRHPEWRRRWPWLAINVLYLADHLLSVQTREFQAANPWARQLLPLTTLLAFVLAAATATNACWWGERENAGALESGRR